MSANDEQVGGEHYTKHGDLQHWDVVFKFKLDYFQGQITKYVMRWRDKGGLQDLRKAQHFLQKYIELEEGQLKKLEEPMTASETFPEWSRRQGAEGKKP